ncbi:MAG: hypothetical protein NC098_06460 [Lachnoclostridium sp.]|nr:hypothetical protein [Lachnoclostridium sp.]
MPGLQEARKKLQVLNMSVKERRAYDAHIDNIMIQNDVLSNTREEGVAEGLAAGIEIGHEKGLEEGLEKGKILGREEGFEEGKRKAVEEMIRKMKEAGMSDDMISKLLKHTLFRMG